MGRGGFFDVKGRENMGCPTPTSKAGGRAISDL